ncbi:uncharacterized protein LOC128208423 [Mya arenaria]|uniref:uncharacterized protein LOC128208423 n=1 Tax=Mya arenaria TaxID=6604 RepID=UPI0022E35182|nr:uncharacterized protein LOC128208423 [Mya arenaria]
MVNDRGNAHKKANKTLSCNQSKNSEYRNAQVKDTSKKATHHTTKSNSPQKELKTGLQNTPKHVSLPGKRGKEKQIVSSAKNRTVVNQDRGKLTRSQVTEVDGRANRRGSRRTASREPMVDKVDWRKNMYDYGCNFVISGDFKTRVCEKPDYVENENIHVVNLLSCDYIMDDCIPRVSKDKNVNEYGKQLLEFCKATGLGIVNGRCGLDKDIGKFSFVNSQGCSLIDYVLCENLSRGNADLDVNLLSFTDIMDIICKPLFKRNICKKNDNSKENVCKDAEYFDSDCFDLKRNYYKCLNYYRNNPCDVTRIDMVHARRDYKNEVKKKFVFYKSQTCKLENAKMNNAKLYWKMLKGSIGNNSCSLTSGDFVEYFRSINDPESVFF